MDSDPTSKESRAKEAGQPPSGSEDETVALGPGEAVAGRIVANRYQILGRLGMGGFGEVFEALDSALDRRVALKLLRADRLNVDSRSRFLREARATAKLIHPNIALIYDVLDDAGDICLVLELVVGEPLDAILRRGALASDRALAIASEILEGLRAAHALRIVHRDVKPANILVTPDGMAKLTDFGIARLLDQSCLTSADAIVGTPSYMAPEQIEGKELTEAVDLWALGCVLHEMLSGTRAFGGNSSSAAVAAILAGRPNPLPQPKSDLDREAQRITLALLSLSPATRIASASDLAERTTSMKNGGSRVRSIGKSVTSRRSSITIAALLFTLAIAGSGVALWNKTVRARHDAKTAALTFDFRSFEESILCPDCTRFSASFESGDLMNDFLRPIAGVDGVNIVVAPGTPLPKISAHISNLPWPLALQSVLSENNLSVISRGNIFIVATESRLREMAGTQLLIYDTEAANGSGPSVGSLQQWCSKWGRVLSAERGSRRLYVVEDLDVRVAFIADNLRRSGVIAGIEEKTALTWACPEKSPDITRAKGSAVVVGFRPLEPRKERLGFHLKSEDIRTAVSRFAEPAALSYRIDNDVIGRVSIDLEGVDPVDALDLLLGINGLRARCDKGVLAIEINRKESARVEASFALRHYPAAEAVPRLRLFGGEASEVKLNSDGLIHAAGTDADILRMGIVASLLDDFAAAN